MTALNWYFYTWTELVSGGRSGSNVCGCEGDFDLEQIHESLLAENGSACMVTFYRMTNARNAAGYRRFCANLQRKQDPRRGLKVVRGDGD